MGLSLSLHLSTHLSTYLSTCLSIYPEPNKQTYIYIYWVCIYIYIYVRNLHENGTPKTMQADVPFFCMVDGCGCRLPGESFRSEIEQ